MLNKKSDLYSYTTFDIFQIVVVYRLVHLKKDVPTTELPGLKSLVRSICIHNLFIVYKIKSVISSFKIWIKIKSIYKIKNNSHR